MFLVEVARDMERAFADRRIVVGHRGDQTTFAQAAKRMQKIEGVETGQR